MSDQNSMGNKDLLVNLALTLLLLAGCSTPYQRYSTRGGYEEMRIDSNRFYVAFIGNGYTDLPKTERMARYRAAEIADREGYPYFRILESYTDNSSYSAQVGVGASRDQIFERPITVLIVAYYDTRPGGPKVLTPDDILR